MLFVINICIKYVWVVLLKDKKVLQSLMHFKNVVCAIVPWMSLAWLGQGSEFYNRSVNKIEMYLSHNE